MGFWRILLAAGVVLGIGLQVCPAGAAIRANAFYFHPHGGVYDFHEDENQKDAVVYGFGLGYRFSRNWSSEIIGSFIDSEAKSDETPVDAYLLRWEALYNFRPGKSLVPYLSGGIGGLLLDHHGGDTDLDGVVGYGIGLQAFLTDSIAFRLDGRHFLTVENRRLEGREFNNLMASAGLVLQVGGEEEKPQLIDSDGDGVIDAFDRCPDTRLGVPVDGYGCPADADRDGIPDYLDRCPDTPVGVTVDREGCPRDGDRDGVPDHLDKCPDTPAGTRVDSAGCPAPMVRDSDGDGVPDDLDRCPGTPAGVAVDATGCPPAVSVEPPPVPVNPTSLILHMPFAPGQTDLRPEDHTRLQQAVAFVRAHPQGRLIVEGHTDSIGPDDVNLQLSQARAENVRRYLLRETGIDPARIEARGFGEGRPVGDNATPEGRLQNRRVVIRVE